MCFFFNDTATTEIYTLSLHDALPICSILDHSIAKETRIVQSLGWNTYGDQTLKSTQAFLSRVPLEVDVMTWNRSEEHTSELQSRQYLVCRLLLEKKNNDITIRTKPTK